jgi:hypothetical protein
MEYFGRQTRQLIAGIGEESDAAKNNVAFCAELFADPSLTLPQMLANKDLPNILSDTNKKRNDWSGHGGIVGQDESRRRNDQLLGNLQRLRKVFGNIWNNSQLIYSRLCKPHNGVFDNEVAILMGSNSEFLKETRQLPTWLDTEHLYLVNKESGRVLRLLPLVQVGHSPQSTKNACYFFNRKEKDGLRFVSYHYIDQPEIISNIEASSEISSLFNND